MKKFFTLILCLTFVRVTFAQEKKLTYGVKASFNLSTFMGKDIDGLSMKPGFNAGVLAEYRFCKLFASARYNFGLTNVIKDGANKNGVLQIGLGYKF